MAGIKTGETWFKKRGWTVKPFQKETWKAVMAGQNGLLNTPTGSGKTLALFTPILIKEHERLEPGRLIALWVTPLRSLAKEITTATQEFSQEMGIPVTVELRNGDTPPHVRKRQREKPPFMLVITPESLHLLLSYKESPTYFKHLKYIIVDEWHELMGSKRGVQSELAIATLNRFNTQLQIWGISATIGNLEEARRVLLHSSADGPTIRSNEKKKVEVVTLLPDSLDELLWSGHYGSRMTSKIVETIQKAKTSLIFTNTRAQCEVWFQNILEACPDLAGEIALHHGSLSKEIRLWVEDMLKTGELKAVVCTSSLDLGVDFPAVDSVIQIGGPKGVARFIQRAGRSGHHPGGVSRIHFVPTHALEIIEGAALRDAIEEGSIEERSPMVLSLDVLAQFIVTLALTGLYTKEDIEEIARSTHAFALMNADEWRWVLNFVQFGSESLKVYDEYKKVGLKDGKLIVDSRKIASRHRMHIGTIVSDNMLSVKFQKGGYIGTIEEWFISKLNPGDSFVFTGRMLELIRIKDMQVHVRASKKKKGQVATYSGGRLPLSARLGHHIREQLSEAKMSTHPEKKHLKGLLDFQAQRSIVPKSDELLLEMARTREGSHLFCFPFEGKFVHEAMASLLAYRISLVTPITFSMASSDYGFELLSDEEWDPEIIIDNNLFSPDHLLHDLNASLNLSEFAMRKFRDIAAIAGLVFQGFPGAYKKAKDVHASTQLLFKVFKEYEPDNLLYKQSFTETFQEAVQEQRLRSCMESIEQKSIILKLCEKPSPLAFPILADRLRSSLSSENYDKRIQRMISQYGS